MWMAGARDIDGVVGQCQAGMCSYATCILRKWYEYIDSRVPR